MSKDPITVSHTASGASFTINPFGAHITSWTNSDGKSLIFMSHDAIMDGSKAIRGENAISEVNFVYTEQVYGSCV
jgi:D-hexose-6-phosphate mutarotase